MKKRDVLGVWSRVLHGHTPFLSIEITKECPLHCPGCYAYALEHLGPDVTLRQLSDYRGRDLVTGWWRLSAGKFTPRMGGLVRNARVRNNRAATDMMVPRNGPVTLAGARIQEKCGPQGAPFLLCARFADGLQIEQILLAELEGTPLPREGHVPLKHKSS